jgi:large subunit ribosomal protein L6e
MARKAAKGSKTQKPRNYEIVPGVMRFSRARMFQKRGLHKKKPFPVVKREKPKKELYKIKKVGGEKNGGERKVLIKKPASLLTSERSRVRPKSRKAPFSKHKHHLRKSLTPGTVVIILAGRHKGKRAVFLKQLNSGLLLITGPFKLNACPLRRINQIYVIATKTKLDISKAKIPEHLDDKYFRRARRTKKATKSAEPDIFASKKEAYVLSDQRKKDQGEVDKEILAVVKAHPDKKYLFGYLGSTWSLRKNEYPHALVF